MRLLVTRIIGLFEAGEGVSSRLRGVRYRRISLECQREKLFGGTRNGGGSEACFSHPHHHRMRADTHGNPAPNAANITRPPSRILPWPTAASKATGIEAADVFPYRSR